ncbi:hypothetical protein J6590_058169 [Homalodisca vitripennis]|nr:hypothetical protein J6590_058169 [Homalodisca vitripennis]
MNKNLSAARFIQFMKRAAKKQSEEQELVKKMRNIASLFTQRFASTSSTAISSEDTLRLNVHYQGSPGTLSAMLNNEACLFPTDFEINKDQENVDGYINSVSKLEDLLACITDIDNK